MRACAVLLLGGWLTSACGGSPLHGSRDGATPADANAPGETAPADANAPDATDSGDGPLDGDVRETLADCAPPLVSAAELAATPRADTNLELLALRLSPGKIVVDGATYERVVRDVGAIRRKAPELATISYFPYHDGRTIFFNVPLDTAAQMEAGTYRAWDCLNDTYGAALPPELIRIGDADHVFGHIKLEGIYAVDLVVAEYARLPGITSTGSTSIGGDGPTICATSGPSTWHYVFDAASGDCPAGCIDHAYRHFTTGADGAVTEVAAWSTKSGTPRPAWVNELASPAICH